MFFIVFIIYLARQHHIGAEHLEHVHVGHDDARPRRHVEQLLQGEELVGFVCCEGLKEEVITKGFMSCVLIGDS